VQYLPLPSLFILSSGDNLSLVMAYDLPLTVFLTCNQTSAPRAVPHSKSNILAFNKGCDELVTFTQEFWLFSCQNAASNFELLLSPVNIGCVIW